MFEIKCPWCSNTHDALDYIEPNDVEGTFMMDCEGCDRPFSVEFETYMLFKTEKNED